VRKKERRTPYTNDIGKKRREEHLIRSGVFSAHGGWLGRTTEESKNGPSLVTVRSGEDRRAPHISLKGNLTLKGFPRITTRQILTWEGGDGTRGLCFTWREGGGGGGGEEDFRLMGRTRRRNDSASTHRKTEKDREGGKSYIGKIEKATLGRRAINGIERPFRQSHARGGKQGSRGTSA